MYHRVDTSGAPRTVFVHEFLKAYLCKLMPFNLFACFGLKSKLQKALGHGVMEIPASLSFLFLTTYWLSRKRKEIVFQFNEIHNESFITFPLIILI